MSTMSMTRLCPACRCNLGSDPGAWKCCPACRAPLPDRQNFTEPPIQLSSAVDALAPPPLPTTMMSSVSRPRRPARRRNKKLPRNLPIYIGAGLLFLLTIGVLLSQFSGNPAAAFSARIDPQSLESTRRWAEANMEELRSFSNDRGNAFQIDEVREKMQRELQASLHGKRVTWDLPVTQITRSAVCTENMFPGDAYTANLIITHRVPNKATWSFTGKKISPYDDKLFINLAVGKDISVDQARRIKVGDTVTITGTVNEAKIISNRESGGHVNRYYAMIALSGLTAQ